LLARHRNGARHFVRLGTSSIAFLLVLGTLTYRTVGRAQEKAKLGTEEAKKLKNPVPFTKKSIAQGRNLFARNCTGCHGPDGKAMVDVVADATDLTDPKGFRDGSTDGEIYRSIRDGASSSMPAFKSQISKDEDLWHLVNYIHNLWPDSSQPPLQDDKSK
jgi:mono/diheme cytochrome c family protein